MERQGFIVAAIRKGGRTSKRTNDRAYHVAKFFLRTRQPEPRIVSRQSIKIHRREKLSPDFDFKIRETLARKKAFSRGSVSQKPESWHSPEDSTFGGSRRRDWGKYRFLGGFVLRPVFSRRRETGTSGGGRCLPGGKVYGLSA